MKEIKKILLAKLEEENIFWSYQNPDYSSLPDEAIISNVIQYLDSDEIDMLFQLYDFETIKKTWLKEIVPLDRLHTLNRFLAYVYFGIKNPDEYLTSHRIPE